MASNLLVLEAFELLPLQVLLYLWKHLVFGRDNGQWST